MTELSPSAQSILNAAEKASWDWSMNEPAHYSDIAIAVLTAAADEILCSPRIPRDEYSTSTRLIDKIFRDLIKELKNHK